MKSILVSLLFLFPTVAHATEPMTESEARASALGLYEHVLNIARDGLEIRVGVVTEKDPQQLLQSAAALLGASAQFQEQRARDLVVISETGHVTDRNLGKYESCGRAANYLAEYAVRLSGLGPPDYMITAFYDRFLTEHKRCGYAVGAIFSPWSGGTRF
ncbi:hypothetical protein FMN63_00220 [Stappia sp. BW2]|uniref:hypothetical protein n=1 Tax=Stappia sp. BW2 TaxID=2592622 RepID=UPI0011DE7AE8|nr:hypothetical protein [Stappia sp. BW2]TYC80507.1 hypothetical protein FMN63_00220 [Stappia sp. BW2]